MTLVPRLLPREGGSERISLSSTAGAGGSQAVQRSRVSRSGFTLIEIVVVLTILATLLAMGLTILSRGRANRELDGAAQELTSELKYARSLAMNSGGATVTLTTSSGVVTITNHNSQLMKKYTLAADITLSLSGIVSPLTFNPNGSTSSAGSIIVTSQNTGRAGTITINQTAGTASVNIK